MVKFPPEVITVGGAADTSAEGVDNDPSRTARKHVTLITCKNLSKEKSAVKHIMFDRRVYP